LGAFWLSQPRAPESAFDTFRSRMVRTVIRQYTMRIITNDMTAVRTYLATNHAPADYQLPAPLLQLPVLGADILSWGEQPVTMVCFDSLDEGTLFLFVLNRADLKPVPPVPPAPPQYWQVSQLMTASWSQDGKTYVLATTGSVESLRRRF
jgi:hypothetical protein